MKRIRNLLIIVIVVAVAYWLFTKYEALPSFSNLFKPKSVIIENTPVVVKQIQAIAQLVTISAYEELVADTSVTDTKTINLPLLPAIELPAPTRKLVIIGKSTTNIGINMQQLRDDDISGTKDSIHIILPAAQILDAIVNPSDVEVFIEEGTWDNTAVANLVNKIRYLAISDAMCRGLLAQSEKKAVDVLTNFFKAAGYNKVVIQFRGNGIRME
jgi:Protein of unknown function (DUF4230)